MLCVLLLAFVLDGELDAVELKLWRAAVEAAGSETAGYYEDRIMHLCYRFRNSHPTTSTRMTCAVVVAGSTAIYHAFDCTATTAHWNSTRLDLAAHGL